MILSLLVVSLSFVSINSVFAANYYVAIQHDASIQGCEISNTCFSPSEISIRNGDTITWINHDSTIHRIKTSEFDVTVNPNNSFSNEYDDQGQYHFSCAIHPWMQGDVTVLGTLMPPQSLNAKISSSNSIALSWLPSNTAVSYNIDVKIGSGSWQRLANTFGVTFTHSNIDPNHQTYSYRVSSYDGVSSYSTPSSVVTVAPAPSMFTKQITTAPPEAYVNEAYGFMIISPQNWIVEENVELSKDSYALASFRSPNVEIGFFITYLNIGKVAYDELDSDPEYFSQIISQGFSSTQIKTISSNFKKYSDGYRFFSEFTQPVNVGNKFVQMKFAAHDFILNTGEMYRLRFYSPYDNYEREYPIFSKAMDSFYIGKVTKQPPKSLPTVSNPKTESFVTISKVVKYSNYFDVRGHINRASIDQPVHIEIVAPDGKRTWSSVTPRSNGDFSMIFKDNVSYFDLNQSGDYTFNVRSNSNESSIKIKMKDVLDTSKTSQSKKLAKNTDDKSKNKTVDKIKDKKITDKSKTKKKINR